LALLNIETNNLTPFYSGFQSKVTSICWKHKSSHLYAASQDGNISEYDGEKREVIKKWTNKRKKERYPSIMRVGYDDAILVVAFDHIIKGWNANTMACVLKIEAHSTSIKAFEISQDNKYLISTSGEKSILVWEIGKIKSPAGPICVLNTNQIPSSIEIVNLGHKSHYISSQSFKQLELFKIKVKNLGGSLKSLKPVSIATMTDENIIASRINKNASYSIVCRTIANIGIRKCPLLNEEGKLTKTISIQFKQAMLTKEKQTLDDNITSLIGATLSVNKSSQKSYKGGNQKLSSESSDKMPSSVLIQSLNSEDVDNLKWIIKDTVM